ncbi:MAG: ABC transporter permease [Planctomycetes bacterium]|nr:ABC transporter permease [Planctomycetota bacterium]
MGNTWAITRREFGAYFNSPIAYVFIAAFLGATMFFFFTYPDFLAIRQASLDNLFNWVPWIFMFFIPAVTMRLWAEERKAGTLEVLLTMPVTTTQAVLGKFLASVAFLAVAIAGTFPLPVLVCWLGDPDRGPMIGGYLGTLLMGAAYIAVGCFLSSITRNQIIAFIISLLVTFGFVIIGQRDFMHYFPTISRRSSSF